MKKIYIGADHGGFDLKSELCEYLTTTFVEFEDIGVYNTDSVDYPDIATKVCKMVDSDPNSLGVLMCGTGIGISIAANKHRNIRAALCSDTYSARMARAHNDSNVLCMGGRVVGSELAKDILSTFLKSEFEGGRHKRRIDKISELENNI
ncbi:MAG: ribose 5-phosphate isomerase B [Deltaproteobacteria bacterium]|nr:ribose 5-phosphate isomerase B [Deltaproteobacteria bacterium]